MVSRIVLLSLPSAICAYSLTNAPVSLDDFKAEYNLNLPDVNTGTSAAVNILKLNNLIRGTTEPASTEADAQKLWSWYSSVDGTVKASAKAFLEKVETDNLVHEQMLTTFNTELQTALTQGTTAGAVATDAKNYAAIIGDTLPVASPGTTGITAAAVAAYTALQSMGSANQAKAKALAEARLYGSWLARFKKLRDTDSRFTGTSGFQRIVQCLKETMQTTASTDDSNGGQSSWAVYHRVSAANKKLIKDAIVAQMSSSTTAV